MSVQPDSNLADGMPLEARQTSMRNNAVLAQANLEQEVRVARSIASAGTECADLNARIATIDAAARQPQPGFEQDRLKEQRKRARDRQFVLHC